MSVTNTESDSIDYEATGKTVGQIAAEEALEELPERFEKYSKVLDEEACGDYVLELIPETNFINSDGDECTHMMMTKNYKTLAENGFQVGMVTGTTTKGVGVKFYFTFGGE